MLKRIPLFVVLLPVFVVVHVAAEFRGHLSLRLIWPGVMKIFLAQLCIFLVSRLFTANVQKQSLITFAISLVYFFFSDLKDALYNAYPQTLLSSYTFLLPVIFLLLAVAIILIRRSGNTFGKLNQFLNLLLLLCIGADVAAIAGVGKDVLIRTPENEIRKLQGCDTCQKPDVYFLLFDAYTSGNTLKNTFQFDNSSLDSFLVKKDSM